MKTIESEWESVNWLPADVEVVKCLVISPSPQ